MHCKTASRRDSRAGVWAACWAMLRSWSSWTEWASVSLDAANLAQGWGRRRRGTRPVTTRWRMAMAMANWLARRGMLMLWTRD